jgi:hypothetical protein
MNQEVLYYLADYSSNIIIDLAAVTAESANIYKVYKVSKAK